MGRKKQQLLSVIFFLSGLCQDPINRLFEPVFEFSRSGDNVRYSVELVRIRQPRPPFASHRRLRHQHAGCRRCLRCQSVRQAGAR